MTYAYDQGVQLPVMSLYDNQIMLASIQAAREMYNQRRQDVKDFYDKYDDFYSPIKGATEEVYDESIGKISKGIEDLYNRGIDPLRSREGFGYINSLIRSVNINKINRRIQEAKDVDEYKKNMAKAVLAGTYNPEMERWLNGGKTLDEWTAADGYWTSTTPGKYTTQDQRIGALAAAMDPEFDAIKTAAMKDGYDYSTVSDARIRKMIEDNFENFITNDQAGRFEYNKALKALGDADKAKQFLKDQYFNTAKKYTKEERKINEFKRAHQQANEQIRAARETAAIKHYYDSLEWDLDGDNKLSPEEREFRKQMMVYNLQKKGDGKPKSKDIFDDARDNPGEYQEYKAERGFDERIETNSEKVVRTQGNTYTIRKEDLGDLIDSYEILSPNGNPLTLTHQREDSFNRYFVPDGKVVYLPHIYKDKNGKGWIDRSKGDYFMIGTLKNQVPTDKKDKNDNVVYDYKDVSGGERVLVKIKRRNYDKQSK